VNVSTLPRRPDSRRNPLTLAGNRRHQECQRKWLLRGLAQSERESLGAARKAAKLRAALADVSVEAIAENSSPVHRLLVDAVNLGDPNVWYLLEALLGAERPGGNVPFTEHRLALIRLLGGQTPPTPSAPAPAARPAPFTADDVLRAASRIVARIADDASESIDWTDEPQDLRQRVLRAAVLKRIESVGDSVFGVSLTLRNLIGFDDEPASDLAEAMERVNNRCEEERRRHRFSEQRRLLDDARSDLNEAA
jgi:hypothetical protein